MPSWHISNCTMYMGQKTLTGIFISRIHTGGGKCPLYKGLIEAKHPLEQLVKSSLMSGPQTHKIK